jgi:hypothetical protein
MVLALREIGLVLVRFNPIENEYPDHAVTNELANESGTKLPD